MGKEEEADKKFTWVTKNLSLKSVIIQSDEFVIGGCKWRLMAYQKVHLKTKYLALFLKGVTCKTFPSEWRRLVKFRLTVVDQLSYKLSVQRETKQWFDQKVPYHGYGEMLLLSKLNAKKGGFIVNDEVKIVVVVDVLQVVGKLDVSEESLEATQPLKRIKLSDHGASVKESIDVNGFQVLPSQAKCVKRIFERHPDMALKFRAKNQHLRTSCINVLLSLIKTLCQSLQDVSIDDLGQAEKALTYLKDSDFKVDWLERKLEEVKEKKMEEQIGKTRMQELEEDLKVFKQKCSDIETLLEQEKEDLRDLKQKCSDTEALLEKEKTKVLATAGAPLTLDDVI